MALPASGTVLLGLTCGPSFPSWAYLYSGHATRGWTLFRVSRVESQAETIAYLYSGLATYDWTLFRVSSVECKAPSGLCLSL